MEDLLSRENIDLILNRLFEWCLEVIPQLLITILLFITIRHFFKKAAKHVEKMVNERVDNGKHSQDESEKRATTLVGLLKTVANSIIWAILIITVLKIIGVDVTTILGSAGILSLAISFGAQELVRDGIAGFFLLLEDRVRIGDVAAINGVSGKVERIDLRTITLRDLSGTIHVFQNGKIDTLANMTKDWSAMVFNIGVAYKENMDQVLKVIERVGNELQQDKDFTHKFIAPIEIFGVNEFADSSVIIQARIKTITSEQWAVRRAFNKRLKLAFDKEGIEIPFPQRNVYIQPGKTLLDGSDSTKEQNNFSFSHITKNHE